MSKKIIVHFGKKTGSSDPFKHFGKKRAVYHELFRQGTQAGFSMYFTPNASHHVEGLSFRNPYLYDLHSGHFIKINATISADAIYDRSGGLEFPKEAFSHKVLNSLSFKKLCADKNLTYTLLSDYMPLSFPINDNQSLSTALDQFSPDEYVVLKPTNGFGGKDILIQKAQDFLLHPPLPTNQTYSLQKFVDTSSGIPHITDSYHDLRIIIVHGEVTLAHVRTPAPGKLLANVAQGGSLREVPLAVVPKNALSMVEEIRFKIDKMYHSPLYSIDFGVENGRPYVFELNDQIGFPSEEMDYRKFIKNILLSLEERAFK